MLSVISQSTIFITRFVYKAWIFCMSFINSNYFWQSRAQWQFQHIPNLQNHYFISILYQLRPTTAPKVSCVKLLISTVPPLSVAIHSRFSVNLCRELREWYLSLLPVHSRHQDGRHQGHRQVSLSSARPSMLRCWGLLHRPVEVGLLFTFKTLYCLHKKSYGLWYEEEGGQWAKECFPTGPTPKFLDQKYPLKTTEQGREHSSTGKQVESSNNMAAI